MEYAILVLKMEISEVMRKFCSVLTPVNGKKANALFSTNLRSISALVVTFSH